MVAAARAPRGTMPYLFETEEHAALRAQARRFATAEIAPHAAAWEEAAEFPRVLYPKLAAAGLRGVGYPESVGGGSPRRRSADYKGSESPSSQPNRCESKKSHRQRKSARESAVTPL